MRKVVCVALVALMIFTAMSAIAEESDLHLLWEIPFGCDEATFADLAYKQTEIGFEGNGFVFAREDQSVKVLGYPAEISAIFLDGLEYIIIQFEPYTISETASASFSDIKNEAISNNLLMLQTIFNRLSEKYGEITGGTFRAGSKGYGLITSDDLTDYNFPVLLNMPDFETLRLAALAEEMVEISLYIGNISVNFDMSVSGIGTRSINSELQVLFTNDLSSIGISDDMEDYIAIDYGAVDVGF